MSQRALAGLATKASTPTFLISPAETGQGAAVIPLDIPGDAFLVRPEKGTRETIITGYDLSIARIVGNPITPAWSDPRVVVATFGLELLVQTAETILRQVFGPGASVDIVIERDPQTSSPILVLALNVERVKRDLRNQFMDRYARETVIPVGAPPPVIVWQYDGAA